MRLYALILSSTLTSTKILGFLFYFMISVTTRRPCSLCVASVSADDGSVYAECHDTLSSFPGFSFLLSINMVNHTLILNWVSAQWDYPFTAPTDSDKTFEHPKFLNLWWPISGWNDGMPCDLWTIFSRHFLVSVPDPLLFLFNRYDPCSTFLYQFPFRFQFTEIFCYCYVER